MEMTTRGAEAENLLRPEQRSAQLMPHNSSRPAGWGDPSSPEKTPFLRNEPVKLTPAWEGSNLPNDTLNLKGNDNDEKTPFLRNEPVKLTPAWEGSNLPNDTLNLKGNDDDEKTPFLRNEPVKLTPAWEGSNLPNDTLNLKGNDDDEKTPFLRNEPVKLTPAWEGSNLPNDTLNLKGNDDDEKTPFLRNEPVKLTPAWEGSNLPNDTLNLKGNDDDEKTPFLRNEPVKLTPAWEGSNLPNDTLNLKGNDDDEKTPFLRNEPVKLTPAWEGSNLPNDTLNLKGNDDDEKTPFLRNEPVKLTPAWEGSNLPNDTLNLKGITMDLAPPKDKWNLIYLTLMFHGLGTLTAWNMFITAKPYFVEYKLAGTDLSKNYLPYVGIASQLPNFLFSWFNVFVRLGGNLTTRIVWSLCMEVLIFVVTVLLAMVDSSRWPEAFFWATMVSVFFLNTFNAIFQNSVFGVAARLPPRYTGAVVTGSNVCGILVSLLGWLTDSASSSARTSAIYYFIAGMFVLLICFDTYFALPLNRFYRYHDTIEQRTARLHSAGSAAPARSKRPPYGTIFRQSAAQLYNIFITFFVTLAVFPAVHSDIAPRAGSYLGALLADNFVRVTCYITFNATAMLGSVTASFVSFPRPRWLILFTTLRIAFIPLFLMCNYLPRDTPRTMPVYIADEWTYWALAALMGWSSGHGSSLGMQYVSTTVSSEHAPTAGMIGGATLITGIVSGILFSGVCPLIVSSSLWSS